MDHWEGGEGGVGASQAFRCVLCASSGDLLFLFDSGAERKIQVQMKEGKDVRKQRECKEILEHP